MKDSLSRVRNEPELTIAKKNISEFLQITNDVLSELNLNFNDIKIDKKKLMEAKSEIANIKKNTKRNFLVLDNFGSSNQKRKRSEIRTLSNSNYKYKHSDENEGSAGTNTPLIITGLNHNKDHIHASNSGYGNKLKRLFKAHEENPKITLNKLAIADIAPGKLKIKEFRKLEQIEQQKANIVANSNYKPISDLINEIRKLNDKHRYDDAEELKVIQKYRDNLEKVNSNVSSMLERAKKESISEFNYKKLNNK
jgi:hypothetical protein